jgi:hypothetical protein
LNYGVDSEVLTLQNEEALNSTTANETMFWERLEFYLDLYCPLNAPNTTSLAH